MRPLCGAPLSGNSFQQTGRGLRETKQTTSILRRSNSFQQTGRRFPLEFLRHNLYDSVWQSVPNEAAIHACCWIPLLTLVRTQFIHPWHWPHRHACESLTILQSMHLNFAKVDLTIRRILEQDHVSSHAICTGNKNCSSRCGLKTRICRSRSQRWLQVAHGVL